MNQKTIVTPIALQHTHRATTTAPWFLEDTEYPPVVTDYRYLINGERAFEAVHRAIANAQKTIDIICWGFQPSMYFIRNRLNPSIGKLLEFKAKDGVRVRVLGWAMTHRTLPLNITGLGGEINLPGRGNNPTHRGGQTATDEQHSYDEGWFKRYEAKGAQAAQRVLENVPVFVTRDFTTEERERIEADLKNHSLDRELSDSAILAMKWVTSHHQKSVLVDYELPERAVGFVMGHNMLDEYWDTDQHTALHRPTTKDPNAPGACAPDAGPRGALPRQDISCQVSGPILYYLHDNFAQAWQKETGEDLKTAREGFVQGKAVTLDSTTFRVPYPKPADAQGQSTQLLAQLLRTQPQPQKPRHDIQSAYLQAVNNATSFIYIENQYFRWPPLAELIKQVANTQTGKGRKAEEHGPLYLFVTTNVTDDGIGKGVLNTQRMLESLGRAEIIPKVTKARRVEAMERDLPPRPRPDGPYDPQGQRELEKWQRERAAKNKAIEDEELELKELPGLKVHICSLVAPDSPPGQKWMPVYIHSKLMIVNDVFTTHGSANINTRSMQTDSELNIAHEWHAVTRQMRRELWGIHTKCKVEQGEEAPDGASDDPNKAFIAWGEIIRVNKDRQPKQLPPFASLAEFHYDEAKMSDLD